MKKFIISLCAIMAFSFYYSYNADAQGSDRNDVLITLDQLNQDAAMRQFKKAKKTNQLEIIRYLVDQATKRFYECKTEEDIDNLQEKLNLIMWYHNQAKSKSIYNTASINELAKKIEKVKVELSGGTPVIIQQGVNRDSYNFYNQDLQ